MYSNDKQQKARILVVDDEYDAALTLDHFRGGEGGATK
jgi:hypothetical protein